MPAGSALLQPGEDVVDGVADSAKILEVLVFDPEARYPLAELGFQRLHELDQRQRVSIKVLDEGGGLVDGGGVALQYLGELSAYENQDPFSAVWLLSGAGGG